LVKEVKMAEQSIQKKLNDLKDQYSKILVELMEKHLPKCVEEAVEATDGPVGKHICCIIDNILSGLKDKVTDELEIDGPRMVMMRVDVDDPVGSPETEMEEGDEDIFPDDLSFDSLGEEFMSSDM
jgi:hypothetical protein